MSVDVFLDTNILVYAVTSDDSEQTKRQRALKIIEAEDFVSRPLPRLESEPKSSAIFGQLFISAALTNKVRLCEERTTI